MSLLKLKSVELVMLSNNPLFLPSSLALNLSQHQGLFQCISSLHQVTKVLKLQLQHSILGNEYSGLNFITIDWSDLLAVQGLSGVVFSMKIQQNSAEASILLHSPFFMVQHSHPYMTTGKTSVAYMNLCGQSDVSAL